MKFRTKGHLNDTLDEMVYIKEVLKEALGGEANDIPLDCLIKKGASSELLRRILRRGRP